MRHDAIKLYEPINILKQIGEDIWLVDGPIVEMSMYGVKIPFSTRMTIVRLSNSELWCHSPTELTRELKAQIDSLGSVRHLISPNKIHYAHIGTWARSYPEAIAWASPGVRDRAAQQKIEVSFNADLENEPPPQWVADLDQLIFRGSRFMDEVVFFHRKSSTVILTDLIENFELNKVSKQFGRLLKLVGIVDPDGKTALDLRMTFWGQKEQSRSCLKRMLQWNPEKVILSHGRWYENNGAAELRRAFRWLE
ncbi:MAG: DUF4336 domain-containing protein [Moorea sp. SIOASIH]|uniref:DUF4336 domain-containing protein n=1 Tax=Moorena sp. SIOASIH TaxID=2607817 RepID=UPI0013B6BAA3|nr:DUF4336 domain-containing protein [Moorena sp. SIOASIH]NEO39126.1 DUF4336 domain-containing protein [Moorena sp. SIOASIH]